MKLLDHMVVLLRNLLIVFHCGYTNLQSHQSVLGFPFLHILASICYFLPSRNSNSNNYEVIACCGFGGRRFWRVAATSALSAGGCDRRTKCGGEELPHVRGQGQRPRVPGCNGAGTAERSYPRPRSGATAERSYPTSEARDGTREEQPHIQGAVAAWVQQGLEEPSHVEGQKGWR